MATNPKSRTRTYKNRRGGETTEYNAAGINMTDRWNDNMSDDLRRAYTKNNGEYRSRYRTADALGNRSYTGRVSANKSAAQIQAQMTRIEAAAKGYKAQKGGGANKRAHLNRAYAAATAVQDYSTLGEADNSNGGVEAQDYRSRIKAYSNG